jgi:hypothetical protein
VSKINKWALANALNIDFIVVYIAGTHYITFKEKESYLSDFGYGWSPFGVLGCGSD